MTPTLRLVEVKKNTGDEATYFAYYNMLKKMFEITSKLREDGLISPLPQSSTSPQTIPIPPKKSAASPDRSPVGSPMLSLTIPTSIRPNTQPSPRNDETGKKKKKGVFATIKGVVKGQRKNSTEKETENE